MVVEHDPLSLGFGQPHIDISSHYTEDWAAAELLFRIVCIFRISEFYDHCGARKAKFSELAVPVKKLCVK
jgi:hypothetical protein